MRPKEKYAEDIGKIENLLQSLELWDVGTTSDKGAFRAHSPDEKDLSGI